MTDTNGSANWRANRLEALAKYRAIADDETQRPDRREAARRRANRVLDQLALIDGPRPGARAIASRGGAPVQLGNGREAPTGRDA